MSKRAKANSIRIIAGEWRSRRLPVLDLPGLRPTTDRVRETVFNWLMTDLPGARCLDAFAGSGALGLESLSRGASHVHFVESNRQAAKAIEATLELLAVDAARAVVSCSDTSAIIAGSGQQAFDIVFLDPPFSDQLLTVTAKSLEAANCLSGDCLIYVEHDTKNPAPELPENWQLYREGRAGRSRYGLYTRSA
ncbi:MAG: 16S rRNA (guanine(966)-N(2))-methyltransferase RsmD [Pseudomonadota bacterium]